MNNNWRKVLATQESAQKLSTGDWLGDKYPGVALPCTKALRKWIEIRYGSVWTCSHVMDVGPWCTDDDVYVMDGGKPRAEIFKGEHVRINDIGDLHKFRSNGAGIDLFPATAKALGLEPMENVILEWRFISPGQLDEGTR